mgnify:CR=1 FL=1
MKCGYCLKYANGSRIESDKRLCPTIAQIVSRHQEACTNVEVAPTFWCDKSGHWIDSKICTARQGKNDECRRCHQKKDVLEMRRYFGRIEAQKANGTIPMEKTKLVRRK